VDTTPVELQCNADLGRATLFEMAGWEAPDGGREMSGVKLLLSSGMAGFGGNGGGGCMLVMELVRACATTVEREDGALAGLPLQTAVLA
jgi:hypothetical protein